MHAVPFRPRRALLAWTLAFLAVIAGLTLPPRAAWPADMEEIDNPAVIELLRGLPARQAVLVPWHSGRYDKFRAGTNREQGVVARRGTLNGDLYRAPGSDRAPYAVLFAGCGNPHEGTNELWARLWARYLQDIGVGALVIDGFSARGVHDVCGRGSRVWADRRVDDAYAALDWLADQPFVDERRVYIMGMSNGARTALLSVSTRETWRYRRFAAAVAFYPVCAGMPNHDMAAPVMILFGDADVEASQPDCAAYTAKQQQAIFAPRFLTYPKAGHLFDVFPFGEDYSRFEVTDSRVRVNEFLARLAPPR